MTVITKDLIREMEEYFSVREFKPCSSKLPCKKTIFLIKGNKFKVLRIFTEETQFIVGLKGFKYLLKKGVLPLEDYTLICDGVEVRGRDKIDFFEEVIRGGVIDDSVLLSDVELEINLHRNTLKTFRS